MPGILLTVIFLCVIDLEYNLTFFYFWGLGYNLIYLFFQYLFEEGNNFG